MLEIYLSEINLQDLLTISTTNNGRSDFINILSPENYPEIVRLIEMIICELEKGQNSFQSAVKGLVWAFIINLSRILLSATTPKPESRDGNIIRVAPALDFISRNYYYPIHIKELASFCNSSLTNFRRVFTGVMHTSPLEYIIRVRIKMASILLNSTEYSIIDVSMKVGYASISSFNRHFKRVMGISPREWRNEKGSIKSKNM
jgi:AraC-like DNA-binding protein